MQFEALLIVLFLADLVLFSLGRGFFELPQLGFDFPGVSHLCSTCLKSLISLVIIFNLFWVLLQVYL